jgi:hypothetical protein
VSLGFPIVASAAILALSAAAQAQAPQQWTILETACSMVVRQCAVNVFGAFPTRADCVAANGGKVEQRAVLNGMTHGRRCEVLLQYPTR